MQGEKEEGEPSAGEYSNATDRKPTKQKN